MPVHPTPGKGTSTAGLDKDEGWGSRNAAGQVIDFQHAGDQGIDHVQGLWKSGIDTNLNPKVTTRNVTPIAGTSATVIWTTLTAVPPGTVRRRVAGAANAAWVTPLTEAAGNKTSHSVALTGLTVSTTYEYQITQPPLTVPGNAVEIIGTFRTPASMEDPEGLQGQQAPPYVGDGAVGTGTQSPTPEPPLQTAAPFVGEGSDLSRRAAEESGVTKGLGISAYTVDTDPGEIIALWRTDAYADGQVEVINTITNQSTVTRETGNKRMNHEVVVSNVEPNTVYLVRVTSTDAAGDTATSDVQEIRTDA